MANFGIKKTPSFTYDEYQFTRASPLRFTSTVLQPYQGDQERRITVEKDGWLVQYGQFDSSGNFVIDSSQDKYILASDVDNYDLSFSNFLQSLSQVRSSLFSPFSDFQIALDTDFKEWSLTLFIKDGTGLDPSKLDEIARQVEIVWQDQHDRDIQTVEREVKAVIDHIVQNKDEFVSLDDTRTLGEHDPSFRDIMFRDQLYTIGESYLNPVLNQALEDVGSAKRVLITMNSQYQMTVVYGLIQDEKKYTVGHGQMVRLITMSQIETQINQPPGLMGSNDNKDTVMILTPNLKLGAENRIEHPKKHPFYKQDEHEALYAAFAENPETMVDAFANLVREHEWGHFKWKESYGYELYALLITIRQFDTKTSQKVVGDDTLHVLMELFCDFSLLDEMIKNGQSREPEKNKRAMAYFQSAAVFRASQGRTRGKSTEETADECVVDLLLSVAKMDEEGNVIVDDDGWAELEQRTQSLRETVNKIFLDAKRRLLKQIIVANSENQSEVISSLQEEDELTVLQARCDGLVEAHLETYRVLYPGRDDEDVRKIIINKFVLKALYEKDFFAKESRPFWLGVAHVTIEYRRRIDTWMQDNLGLDQQSTPFRFWMK